jgi:phenylalanyl-tRNA synthetase beta chain
MKLSLKWILDHIVSFPASIKVHDIITALNRTTAEVELSQQFSIDLSCFNYVHITKIEDSVAYGSLHDSNEQVFLPLRSDGVVGLNYLLCKGDAVWRWALLKDFGSSKDGYMPAVIVQDFSQISWHDDVLEVDNKSITHRPDLWCHRGFAREIAAIFNLELKPLEEIIDTQEVHYSTSYHAKTGSIKVLLQDDCPVRRLAVCEMPAVQWSPSFLSVASRLALIDARPIDALVDFTNYVMFDIGQPMHAFDRAVFKNDLLEVRSAHKGESILLLDGMQYELHPDDIIVASATPLSLAGVMGGRSSGVSDQINSLVIEAGTFHPTVVRLTAARAKVRTESSMRFEKSLDPENPLLALSRYVTLLKRYGLQANIMPIVVLGQDSSVISMSVKHSFIEDRLGIRLESARIEKTLRALGFIVSSDHHGEYRIEVPSWRSTKDVSRPEDIVEEIGRVYGYDRIEPQIPVRSMQPFSMAALRLKRLVEDVSAFGMSMHQVVNYPFYDEELIKRLSWEPLVSLRAKNPMSSNLTRLVTSLVPHLLKNIASNAPLEEHIQLFEINKCWTIIDSAVLELRELAYCWWSKENYTFYQAKEALSKLEQAFNVQFNYRRARVDELFDKPWYDSYQSAIVELNGVSIGIVGSLVPSFYAPVCQGAIVAAELNYDSLIDLLVDIRAYKHTSKFPKTWFDISMFVPLAVNVTSLKQVVKAVDERIVAVDLRDYFENASWSDVRSVTLRYVVQDNQKTLTSDEIDDIWQRVHIAVKGLGVTTR